MSGLTTCSYSPVPHMVPMAAATSSGPIPYLSSARGSASASSTTSAVVRDGCVAANSAPVANEPGIARRTASRLPRSPAPRRCCRPLLQGRQRARRDGVGRSAARLVEEDQPTERRHRLDPALHGRQFRLDLSVGEPGRDEHDVARTFTSRAIGDVQVPVERVACLREHCGSVSGERVERRVSTASMRLARRQ